LVTTRSPFASREAFGLAFPLVSTPGWVDAMLPPVPLVGLDGVGIGGGVCVAAVTVGGGVGVMLVEEPVAGEEGAGDTVVDPTAVDAAGVELAGASAFFRPKVPPRRAPPTAPSASPPTPAAMAGPAEDPWLL
jgi:hypothetical protein